MTYESVERVESTLVAGVSYVIVRMSFSRRMDMMRRVRELARKAEFLEAGQEIAEKMDAALLRAEIDRIYLDWGLKEISGLELDGQPATAATLFEAGPEDLFREAVAVIRAATGLSVAERKN